MRRRLDRRRAGQGAMLTNDILCRFKSPKRQQDKTQVLSCICAQVGRCVSFVYNLKAKSHSDILTHSHRVASKIGAPLAVGLIMSECIWVEISRVCAAQHTDT